MQAGSLRYKGAAMSERATMTTLAEIAAALGFSRQAANKCATKESWPYQEEAVRGGRRRVYPLASLPKDVATAVYLYQHDVVAALAPAKSAVPAVARSVPAVVAARALAPVDAADLDEHQRIAKDARKTIREFVEDYPKGVEAALAHLNVAHGAGMLTTHLAWAYEHCHDKVRAGQTLKTKTYYNWLAANKARGTLAPAKKHKAMTVQPWHLAAVALRQRPQGSTLRWIHDQLVEQKHAVSYDQVARFFREQFSSLDQLKGRFTGSKLRSHKFYQHRTNEGLAPADEVHADGWNTHFSAPHPVTGEFVTYEVWHFHDVATRYVTPPGIGLTEQFEVIAKGLENFVRVFGRPLIVQTDSTKIIKGSARFTQAAQSLEARIGCTIVHPQEVGNSQANGICENFNMSWLDKRSRELATYQNPKQMDELSFKRVQKLTAAKVRAESTGDLALAAQKKQEAQRMGRGLVFDSPDQAREWILRVCEEYNDRPHRSLPKVSDPASGKRRHQTPREALAEHVANGWEPVAVDGDTLIDLFRPHAVVKVTRETVTPYGGMRYRNPDVLGHWNGKDVVVAYDIHDYRMVWVKDLHGAPICEAAFVHATGYRAQTAYEAAEEKRAKVQIRSHENKIKKIEATRMGGAVIEAERVKTIADFLDLDAVEARFAAKPVREKTLLDFLPETPAEKEPESSYMDTVLWLRGEGKKPGSDETPKEVAAR